MSTKTFCDASQCRQSTPSRLLRFRNGLVTLSQRLSVRFTSQEVETLNTSYKVFSDRDYVVQAYLDTIIVALEEASRFYAFLQLVHHMDSSRVLESYRSSHGPILTAILSSLIGFSNKSSAAESHLVLLEELRQVREGYFNRNSLSISPCQPSKGSQKTLIRTSSRSGRPFFKGSSTRQAGVTFGVPA